MFRIDTPAPNRVDLFISGRIDATQMRVGLDRLFEVSEDIENGVMFYDIEDLQLPTAGAIAVEFGQLPRLFSLLGHYDRCAVTSDQGWVRTAAEIEGAMIPGFEIKAFTRDQRDAAEAWLGEGRG